MLINGAVSGLASVINRFLQGLARASLPIIVCVNDMNEGTVSRILKFSNKTKFITKITSGANVQRLQEDLCQLCDWLEKREIIFYVTVMSYIHISHHNPEVNYFLQAILSKIHNYFGVVITNDFKFSKQRIDIEKKVQRILRYIKQQFNDRNKGIVLKLHNSLVRP